MIVAINTRLLIKNKLDGIGRFTFENLKIITKNYPKVEFHFIFDRPFSSDFIFSKNITPHILYPPSKHPILWYIWFEIQLPRLLKKIKADIFFSPDGLMPSKCPCPSVITIHDINFEHYPKDLRWSHSLFYRFFMKRHAKNADHVITVSNFSKNDLIKTYQIKNNKITVVYNGTSNIFQKINNEQKEKTKQAYTNNLDFFVFVGSLHKRKNVNNLLLSFEKYKKNNGTLKLVIIGEKKWLDTNTKKIYQNMDFKNDVILLGRLIDTELARILASSTALCFISLFEGFGIPIIEAMQCGVPVITSNRTCMPEIAQDGAIIIDPENIQEIANAMLKIEKNNTLRQELISKGQLRVQRFDWTISAQKIWEIINSIYTQS